MTANQRAKSILGSGTRRRWFTAERTLGRDGTKDSRPALGALYRKQGV